MMPDRSHLTCCPADGSIKRRSIISQEQLTNLFYGSGFNRYGGKGGSGGSNLDPDCDVGTVTHSLTHSLMLGLDHDRC